MRKAFIFALLAATAAVPTAAMAQGGDRSGARQQRQENRAQRQEARQQNRQEARQENRQEPRQENRPERQQARQQNRAQRQQARQQQPAVQVQQVQQRQQRQQRVRQAQPSGQWMGNPNDPRMEAHRRRYEQIERQNARRNGTPEQYRSVVQQQGTQRQARRENRQDWRQDRRENRQDWRQDRRADRRDWNRGWRNDNRYDWQRYRNTNRFVFRIQPYYAPYRGYSYSRFSIGHILDRLFWGNNYWINDPWTYRLPAAPYGTQWVRYYNDIVLVDTYTGEIVDVIHDFFW